MKALGIILLVSAVFSLLIAVGLMAVTGEMWDAPKEQLATADTLMFMFFGAALFLGVYGSLLISKKKEG